MNRNFDNQSANVLITCQNDLWYIFLTCKRYSFHWFRQNRAQSFLKTGNSCFMSKCIMFTHFSFLTPVLHLYIIKLEFVWLCIKPASKFERSILSINGIFQVIQVFIESFGHIPFSILKFEWSYWELNCHFLFLLMLIFLAIVSHLTVTMFCFYIYKSSRKLFCHIFMVFIWFTLKVLVVDILQSRGSHFHI